MHFNGNLDYESAPQAALVLEIMYSQLGDVVKRIPKLEPSKGLLRIEESSRMDFKNRFGRIYPIHWGLVGDLENLLVADRRAFWRSNLVLSVESILKVLRVLPCAKQKSKANGMPKSRISRTNGEMMANLFP